MLKARFAIVKWNFLLICSAVSRASTRIANRPHKEAHPQRAARRKQLNWRTLPITNTSCRATVNQMIWIWGRLFKFQGLVPDKESFAATLCRKLLAAAAWASSGSHKMPTSRVWSPSRSPDTLLHDSASLDSLKRETRLGLSLAHPHIVRIYDFQNDENAAAISMEYVDGGNLWNCASKSQVRS